MAGFLPGTFNSAAPLDLTPGSLSRQIQELLELIRQYGPEDVAGAIEKAALAHA
jgi:hypothetical protein